MKQQEAFHNRLGIGTWYLGENRHQKQEEIAAIQYAIEHGVKVIDTAEMYGNGRSELLVGEAIRPYQREEIYLISKVLPSNANRHYLEQSLDASLKRLQTSYLDMYLYHWRGNTPLFETVEMLEAMKEKGKIKSWGVSNFDIQDMKELFEVARGNHCKANQVLYHLGSRGIEYALKPLHDQNNITTIAYCPLAQGGVLKRELMSHPRLIEIAEELNISLIQLLLCFTMQPNILSIPRTGKVNHMKELIECQAIRLPQEILKELDKLYPAPNYAIPLDIQ